ncbi:MAG: spermidine synthase [Acidobacteriota bacterium]
MSLPWRTVDTAETDEGLMILMQRGDREFVIKMETFVLMNSRLNLTEVALAGSACGLLAPRRRPRVLIGGLGMAFTLRAALDALPPDARVTVAEINPVVERWCRGPLKGLTDGAVEDPRVEVHIGDVAGVITRAARGRDVFDAIILDLYQGTHDANDDPRDPFYGKKALETARKALKDDGVFAVWTEFADPAFEKRLRAVGFDCRRTSPGKGGPRHIVYLATKIER